MLIKHGTRCVGKYVLDAPGAYSAAATTGDKDTLFMRNWILGNLYGLIDVL